MKENLEEGAHVLVLFKNGKKSLHLLTKKGIHTHRGYLTFEQVSSSGYGSKLTTNLGEEVFILKPTFSEIVSKIARRTQIVYPKEIGYALVKLGIESGSNVLEVGSGSGATTIFLASIVKPSGKVVSIDVSEESLRIASENLKKFSLLDYVDLRLADVRNGIEEKDFFDAAFVDIPEPWIALEKISSALKPSSRVALVVPTYNQLVKLSENLPSDFVFYEAVDIILQEIQVKKGAVRPLPLARAHNAFLVFLVNVKS
ncbi:MAG: tRNA (adenine-N1)-methyltransferase [Thermoproteota archaeon]